MEKELFYRVCLGDTLLSVCRRFSAPPCAVMRDNLLEREIEEGDVLYICRAGDANYIAAPGDTLLRLSQKSGKSADEIARNNGVDYIFFGLPLCL